MQDQRVVPSAGAQPNDLVALEVGMVGVRARAHTAWRLGEAGRGAAPGVSVLSKRVPAMYLYPNMCARVCMFLCVCMYECSCARRYVGRVCESVCPGRSGSTYSGQHHPAFSSGCVRAKRVEPPHPVCLAGFLPPPTSGPALSRRKSARRKSVILGFCLLATASQS